MTNSNLHFDHLHRMHVTLLFAFQGSNHMIQINKILFWLQKLLVVSMIIQLVLVKFIIMKTQRGCYICMKLHFLP